MNARRFLPARIVLPWYVAVLATGCAAIDLPNPTADDITEKRQARNEEAVRRFEKQRGFAEFQAALSRWQQGDVQRCRERLEQLLARSPNHREAQLLMADVLLASHQPQEAVAQIGQALAAHPKDAKVHHAMGLLLDTIGQRADALPYYEQATKLEPANEVYAASYQSVLNTASSPPSSASSDGSLRVLAPPAGTDLAEPDGIAEVTVSDAPENMIQQGEEALAAGSADVALAYFRQAVSSQPDNPQIPLSVAVLALRHNQPDVAIALAGDAVRRFPKSARLHRTLATAYYRKGDYASSQVVLQQALSLDKSDALSYFLMGCALAKLGHPEAAEAHLRQARRINPRYSLRR